MKTSNLLEQQASETAPLTHMCGFAGQELMMTRITFEAGAIGTSHAHPHEQMTIVLRGEIEFTLGDEHRLLKAGDVVSIPSAIYHGVVARTAAEVLDVFTPVRQDLIEKLNL